MYIKKIVTSTRRILHSNGKINSLKFSTRSKKIPTEPPHMVREDNDADPSTISVPYLTDNVREDIYRKFVSGAGGEWTVDNIAQHYNTSIQRVKGVIFLMDNRRKMLLNDSKALADLCKTGDNDIGYKSIETTPNLLDPQLVVPPILKQVYSIYKHDPETTFAVLVEEYNKIAAENSAPNLTSGEDYGEKVLSEAFGIIESHERRAKDLYDYNSHMENLMDRFREAGVNTSFRETGRIRRRTHNKHVNTATKADTDVHDTSAPPSGPVEIPQSLLDSYFPNLLSDEDTKKAEYHLLKRIAEETQATIPIFDMNYFDENFVKKEDGKLDSTVPEQIGDKHVSRWKYAFRDLSQSSKKNKHDRKNYDRNLNVTKIRTRSGK